MYVCLERTTHFPPPLHTPPDDHSLPVTARDLQVALVWLQRLSIIFQAAQRAIFGVRRIELLSLHAHIRHATVVSQPRQRTPFRSPPLPGMQDLSPIPALSPPQAKIAPAQQAPPAPAMPSLSACSLILSGGATCKKTGHYNHRPTEFKQTYTK